jgi:pyruvate dehydrogenase E1 component alpha subunit/2-oxoisovalerate dehydrogenase E1 component alpha subunit
MSEPGRDAAELVPLPYSAEQLPALLGPDWSTRLLEAYRWMRLGRALDSRMLGLQRQGRIGFYGPATGQEAVSVGAGMASRPEDWIVPGLREQLVALVRGHTLERYVDHLFANDQDPARGRQMPCHPTAREVHYVSMSSVIGTQITHGVGIAYALRRAKDPGVVLTFFGDGATSSNDFHAGLNLGGVFQLPVVFCCTNNQWAISVPVERQTNVARLSEKGAAYGIPGRRADGTDIVAVLVELQQALSDARAGHGPTLLEFVLFRMTPHSSSDDPSRYQATDWMRRAVAHDPCRRLEELLGRLGVLPAEEREALAEEVDSRVRRAIAHSEAIGPPTTESLSTDVWASGPRPQGPGAVEE